MINPHPQVYAKIAAMTYLAAYRYLSRWCSHGEAVTIIGRTTTLPFDPVAEAEALPMGFLDDHPASRFQAMLDAACERHGTRPRHLPRNPRQFDNSPPQTP